MATLSPRRAAAAGLLAVLSLAACGSDAETADSQPVTTSPEEHIADDADVTAGLGRMTAIAATISATVASGDQVDDAQDQLEVDWQLVEGTVRQNEPDMYLQIEDDLGGLDKAARDGDAAETARFADDLAGAIAGYLAAHP